MLKSRLMKMDELKKTTTFAALFAGAGIIMLFICIFRVSNATTLLILINTAIITMVAILTASRLRYAVVLLLTAALAVWLVLRHEGSGLSIAFLLVRFAVLGVLVTYFGTLMTQASHKIYRGMQELASEREAALDETRRLVGRLNALVMVITAITERGMTANLREVFAECLEAARGVFNADSGLIYRVDRESREMSVISSFGYSDVMLEKMRNKGVSRAELCQACVKREPVIVDNLATDDKCRKLASVRTGSAICIPIMTEDNLWGVLHLRRQHPDAFSTEDTELAQAMSFQFALAMQRAYLFEQVNLLAITDPLTGLYNYRKLMSDAANEVRRSRRYRHPFSFIMVDIDHFKDFNDLHGHQTGDEVLRAAARTLDSVKREVDNVYRYGGEEFSILLPETDWREAFEVAEKLRGRVELMEVLPDGSEGPLRITVSMGVASFPEAGDDVDGITSAADEALYKAKETGRNRVVAHEDMLGTGAA